MLWKLPGRDESDPQIKAHKRGCSLCRVEVPVQFALASRSLKGGKMELKSTEQKDQAGAKPEQGEPPGEGPSQAPTQPTDSWRDPK